MARYVVVAFMDNEDADKFVKAINEGDLVYPITQVQDSLVYGTIDKAKVFVRGLFAKPTKFCECANPGDKSVRGAKLGWWVHKDCGRPKANQWQHPKNLLAGDPEGAKPLRDNPSLFMNTKEPAPRHPDAMYIGVIEPPPQDPNNTGDPWRTP